VQGLVICWIIIWGFKDLGDLGDEGGGVAGGVLMMFWIGDFATAILVPGDTDDGDTDDDDDDDVIVAVVDFGKLVTEAGKEKGLLFLTTIAWGGSPLAIDTGELLTIAI